jgi:hypothetical protein
MAVLQASFVAVMVLAYVGICLPTIRSLDRALKASRATLLLFPHDIVNSVPAIRNMMKQFARTKGGK